MISSRGEVFTVLFVGVAIAIATIVVACKAVDPGPTPSSSESQASSSGPGVAVFDPDTGQTLTLPPDEAAEAIRSYWTPERMKQARPAAVAKP